MKSRRPWPRSSALAVLATLITVSNAVLSVAAGLELGDIVVVQQTTGDVYKVNSKSGRRTLIADTGFDGLSSALVSSEKKIVTTTRSDIGVLEIDPVTGASVSIASGDLLSRSFTIAFEGKTSLLVGDLDSGLVRVDLSTSEQSLLTTFNDIADIEVAEDGTIYLLDYGRFESGRILTLNPDTGELTTISDGGFFEDPVDMVFEPSGSLLVSNAHSLRYSEILRVDIKSGQQERLFSWNAQGTIALEDPSHLLIGEFRDNMVLRANIHTGEVTELAGELIYGNTTGIAVVVAEPETSALLNLAAVSLLASIRRLRRKPNSVSQLRAKCEM